jgi:hypothetical protein
MSFDSLTVMKKDLGEFEGSYSISIPPHGAVLVKIGIS